MQLYKKLRYEVWTPQLFGISFCMSSYMMDWSFKSPLNLKPLCRISLGEINLPKWKKKKKMHDSGDWKIKNVKVKCWILSPLLGPLSLWGVWLTKLTVRTYELGDHAVPSSMQSPSEPFMFGDQWPKFVWTQTDPYRWLLSWSRDSIPERGPGRIQSIGWVFHWNNNVVAQYYRNQEHI